MNNHNLTFGSIPTTCFRTERPSFFHKGESPVDVDVPIEKLIRQMSQTVRNDVFTIIVDGCPIKVHPKWIRDHVHEMKAYKHWESDLKDYLDYIIRHQHKKGFFYEMVQVEGEEHTTVVNDDCLYFDKRNGIVLIRLELEADIEYLMVEGVYTVYQATGDFEWMKSVLPAIEKGIEYCTSDPKRWDQEHGLIKRAFTIDTWDFANRPDAQFNRNIVPEDTMGIMHGDNSGVYAAMMMLAILNDEIENHKKSEEWRNRAKSIKENLNLYCWNGRFYQHQLFLNNDINHTLEKERLSLSNTYDMNRGITTLEQGQKIISEYKLRRKTTEAFCEWFTIDPPYDQFFTYSAGEYINGSIASLTAGELAKAAFQYGEEEYGWDILCRLMNILERDGELFFMYNPKTGKNAGGGPSGWGAAAILSAIEEGLAGIKDIGVCFNKMIYSPRWCVTAIKEVKYITGYEISHVLVETQYEEKESGMMFRIAAPSKEIQCHILIPENKEIKKVLVNHMETSYEDIVVGKSHYIEYNIYIDVHERNHQKYEMNPVTEIEIIYA